MFFLPDAQPIWKAAVTREGGCGAVEVGAVFANWGGGMGFGSGGIVGAWVGVVVGVVDGESEESEHEEVEGEGGAVGGGEMFGSV